MDEEPELLDWGHEDDELQMSSESYRKAIDLRRGGDPDDAEDTVSLGGDEEDDGQGYVYQSRAQDDNSKASFSTPKSATFHQPQRSSREPPSSSQKQAHSQGSPQHSPLRSNSPSKVTHALPPKPVVASVPFLHPSHPSLIEATAMSRGRPDRDKKVNGSVPKTTSSGDADPLPPDWELRHPRSGSRGVYYYNTRTHESTWTRPVSSVKSSFSRDKDQGKAHTPESRSGGKHMFDSTGTKGAEQSTFSRLSRPEVDSPVSPPNLSYEDRHYRPAADSAQKPIQEANRRDERSSLHNASYSGNSFTPPASPKPESARSSWLRDRERQDRHQSSYRQSSPRETSGNDTQPRESQRDSLPLPERHWGPSRYLPSEITSRRKSASSTNYQQEVVGMAEPKTPAFEAVWSSTLRHRSPPPHFRTSRPPQASQAIALVTTSTATAPRQKTRFDQPEKAFQSSLRSQEHDVYATDMFWQRDQPPGTTLEQSVENAAKGMRPDDFASNVISDHRTSLAGPPHLAASHSERSASVSPLSAPTQFEQSRSRKRQPLTPQSTRFRERPVTTQPEQALPTTTVPIVHRDGGINTQRTSYVGSVPSGPRLQPQLSGSRDHNHPDHSQALRLPPSGPSTTTIPRVRHSRDMPFTPNEFPAFRDRDVMDVDTVPPSRTPFGSNDVPIRAGSGMYADREQNTDLPKGPRAMSSKPSMNMSYPPPPVSPSVSHPAFFAQRAVSVQDRSANKLRDRSPPHLEHSDRWEQHRDVQERQSRSDGGTAREDALAWRSGNQSVDNSSGRRKLLEQDAEGNQDRRESLMNPNRRTTEPFRSFPPNPQPKTLGTNNVPIRNRKAPHGGSGLQPEMPSPTFRDNRYTPPGAGNSEPAQGRVVSRIDTQSRESYEHSSQVSTRGGLPAESYHPTATASAQHRRTGGGNAHADFEGRPPTPYQVNPTPVRSRRDSTRNDAESPRFEQPATQEKTRHMSNWIPRQSSPDAPAIHTSFGGESNYRPVSPLPPPREPSVVSPTWDGSFGPTRRPSGRHHDNARQQNQNQYENAPRQVTTDGDSHHRRQQVSLTDRGEERFTDQHINNATVGLESRLGERYDNQYPEVPYRPHALPLNPSLRRDHDSYIDDAPHQTSDHHSGSHSLSVGRHNTAWIEEGRPRDPSPIPASEPYPDGFRTFDGVDSLTPPPDAIPNRTSKPTRVRRFGPATQSRSDVIRPEAAVDMMLSGGGRAVEREGDEELPRPRSSHDHDRPNTLRRGGSLLDRLSLDNSTTGISVVMASASLRERVLIPSKRDRDEMMSSGDSPSIDASFDFDDGAGGDSRRNRRRNGKSRRGKGRNGVS